MLFLHSYRVNKDLQIGSNISNASYLLLLLFVTVWLGGCLPTPTPLTPLERDLRIKADYAAMFAGHPPAPATVTIEDAMARAIRYNLANRIKIMDVALAQGLTDVASFRSLPSLALSAGYGERDRLPTDTQDLFDTTHSLSVAWNVLDFGVSYLHARQQADRVLIAEELRRKAVHNLFQEVQTTFWRAWAAQRLQSKMEPLLARVQKALENSQEAERQRLQPPMQILDFQKTLLKTWQQIQELWKGLSGAKVTLAEKMNLNPGQDFSLIAPDKVALPKLEQFPPMDQLARFALRQRPELRERDYQARIQSLESYKEMLRLLPGLEFTTGSHYNSGMAYINHVWAESGIKLVWNLLNLLSAPTQIAYARDQELYQGLMRQALSLGVLAQVQIAYRRLVQSEEEFITAQTLSEVNERLFQHAQAGKEAAAMSELNLINREADRIISFTKRDMAYAELQNAVGALFVTLGSDLLPLSATDDQTLEALAATIATRLAAWEGGDLLKQVEKTGVFGEDDSLPLGVGEIQVRQGENKLQFYEADVSIPQWTIAASGGVESLSPPVTFEGDVAYPQWVIENDGGSRGLQFDWPATTVKPKKRGGRAG